MKEFVYYILFLLVTLYPASSDIACSTHATIFRQLEREGFHIDVHSSIELVVDVETAPLWENCSLALRENISEYFYVNPDQLLELSRSGILQACTPDEVDVEAPHHTSKWHVAYIYGKLKRSQNLIYTHIKFPLHLRYQTPKVGGGYSSAILKSPSLLISCKEFSGCRNIQKSKAPCSLCSNETCTWMRFPYKTNANNFTLPVPVGDLNHLPFVSLVTYFLTFGGCFYVLIALVNVNN